MTGPATDYPLPATIRVQRRLPGTVDAYGDRSPPRYTAPETIRVFGYHAGGEEPATAQLPERARYDLTVYAPTTARIKDSDRLIVDGHYFNVDGDPDCWDVNPWFHPGLVAVHCTRWEG